MPSLQEDIRSSFTRIFGDRYPEGKEVRVEAETPTPAASLDDDITAVLRQTFPQLTEPPPPPPPPQPSFLGGVGQILGEATGLSDLPDLPSNLGIIGDRLKDVLPRLLPTVPGADFQGIPGPTDLETPGQAPSPTPARPMRMPGFATEFLGRTGQEIQHGLRDIPEGGQRILAPESALPDRLIGLMQTAFAIPRIAFAPVTASVEQAYDAAFEALPDTVKDQPIRLPLFGETTVRGLSESIGKSLAVNLAFIGLGKMQLKSADLAKTTAMREQLKAQGLIEGVPTPSRPTAPPAEFDIPQRPEPGPLFPEGVQPSQKALPAAPALKVTPEGEVLPRPHGGPVGLSPEEIARAQRRVTAPPAPEKPLQPLGATGRPSPEIPQELSDVATGAARAFLRPPAAEGTTPTAGELASKGMDLRQYAKDNGLGYYKARDKGEIVFDRKQVTPAELKALDKQGKVSEVVNGPGTAPKPEVPVEAVTARTPEGTEIRTVLTETPEQTRAAVAAQPKTTKVEVAPAAEAVPEVLAERQAGAERTIPSTVQSFDVARTIQRLKSTAGRIDPKHRGDVIATGEARLKKLDTLLTGEVPDFIGKNKLLLKDEANRPYLNLLAELESNGNATIGLVKDKNTTSLGPFQVSKPLRKELKLPETASLQQQTAAVEGKVSALRKEFGDDPAAVTTAYWRPATARTIFPKATEPQRLVAGGGPKGAEIFAEAEGGGGATTFITEPTLRTNIFKEAADAAGQVMQELKIPLDPKQGPMYQMADLIASRKVPLERLERALGQRGLTAEDFYAAMTDAFSGGGREGARKMNILSQWTKRLAKQKEDGTLTPADSKHLDALMRVDNVRRALQVTQVATTARNAIAQSVRLGVEGLVDAVDVAIAKVFRPGSEQAKKGLFDDLRRSLELARQPKVNREIVERILSDPKFAEQKERMFGSYLSDIEIRPTDLSTFGGKAGAVFEKAMGGAEKAAHVLNTLNRGQEFFFRRVAFLGKLEARLKARGITTALEKINPAEIPAADLTAAVKHSLELTFAKRYSPEHLPGAFINVVTKAPVVLTGPIPYPRFMVNALEFLFDHNPTGFLKLLSANERAKILAGDTKTLSRAVIGSGMLGAGILLRDSRFAGEKWYQFDIKGTGSCATGQCVDLRPFGPFAAYAFLGEVFKKARNGTLKDLDTKDIVQGLLSANFRAGASVFALDKVLELMQGASNEGAARFLKKFTGELASGFLTPLITIKDVVAQFDTEEAKQRFTGESPFVDPLKARLPIISQQLPEKESPTRADTPVRQAPLLRQGTGLSLEDVNPAEAELNKHDIPYRSILPPQGHPEADQALARAMGPLIERGIGTLAQHPRYQAMDRERQKAALMEAVQAIRKVANQQAKRTLRPEVALELYLRSLPKHLRPLVQESPAYQRAKERVTE